jgi:hypothetical protein
LSRAAAAAAAVSTEVNSNPGLQQIIHDRVILRYRSKLLIAALDIEEGRLQRARPLSQSLPS